MNLSLRLLLLVLIAAVPVLIVQVEDELRSRELRREELSRQLVALAQLGAAQENRLAGMAGGLLAAATESPSLVLGEPGRCTEELRRLHRLLPDLAVIRLISPSGAALCSSGEAVGPTDQELLQLLRAAFETQDTTAVVSLDGDGWTGITFARAVREEAGRPPAVMLASIEGARLSAALAEVPLPAGTDIILLDNEGRILGRAFSAEGQMGTLPSSEELRAALRLGRASAEIARLDGGTRLAGFAPLDPPVGLSVAVTMSRAEAFARTGAQFVTKMTLLGIVFVLASLARIIHAI